MRNIIKTLIILILIISSFSSCKEQENKPVEYTTSSLQEISYNYPETYTEDYRNDSQVSYLLNKNEGIIFIIRWDEGIETDMDERGKEKTINDIDGYYWEDDTGEYTFAFEVKTKNNNNVVYFVCADNKEVFWNIVNSIKIK